MVRLVVCHREDRSVLGQGVDPAESRCSAGGLGGTLGPALMSTLNAEGDVEESMNNSHHTPMLSENELPCVCFPPGCQRSPPWRLG